MYYIFFGKLWLDGTDPKNVSDIMESLIGKWKKYEFICIIPIHNIKLLELYWHNQIFVFSPSTSEIVVVPLVVLP